MMRGRQSYKRESMEKHFISYILAGSQFSNSRRVTLLDRLAWYAILRVNSIDRSLSLSWLQAILLVNWL
jgi:hypothetical protein